MMVAFLPVVSGLHNESSLVFKQIALHPVAEPARKQSRKKRHPTILGIFISSALTNTNTNTAPGSIHLT